MAEEKTFTQEEVNTIVSQRLAREREGQLTPDEIAEYRTLKAQQIDHIQQQQAQSAQIASITTERDSAKSALATANAELEALKREKYLIGKGVSADDLDYVGFKVSKNVTAEKTFEAAADEFLADFKGTAKVDLGGGLGGGTQKATPNAMMNDLIRSAKK